MLRKNSCLLISRFHSFCCPPSRHCNPSCVPEILMQVSKAGMSSTFPVVFLCMCYVRFLCCVLVLTLGAQQLFVLWCHMGSPSFLVHLKSTRGQLNLNSPEPRHLWYICVHCVHPLFSPALRNDSFSSTLHNTSGKKSHPAPNVIVTGPYQSSFATPPLVTREQ